MKQGDNLVELYASAQGEGPAADMSRAELATIPPLTRGEEIVWDALGDLSTERVPAMGGISPIPWSKIVAFAQFHALPRFETEAFVKHVLILDRVLVNRKNQEARKDHK